MVIIFASIKSFLLLCSILLCRMFIYNDMNGDDKLPFCMQDAEDITTVLICICLLQYDSSFFGITPLLAFASVINMDKSAGLG